MTTEFMPLEGAERARYFAPTAICAYLAALCVALIVTSAFLSSMRDALALTGAGVFGLVMSGGLGTLFWRAQRRDLEFRAIATGADAATNFPAVRAAAVGAGWTIKVEEPDASLLAQTADTAFSAGERVAVRFRGQEVLVACIADPGVGFSMVARRRCEAHREFVRATLSDRVPG